MDWKKLQNGSDIRGVAVEGYNNEQVNLTTDVAQILGKAFVMWLKNKQPDEDVSISVGTDSRISGSELKQSFVEGVSSLGVKVFDCGMASTPAMFMATVTKNKPTTAGVMITASHLPYNRNGFKFFTVDGGLNKKDITEILAIAEGGKFQDSLVSGESVNRDFICEYSEFLVDYIRSSVSDKDNYNEPLKGLKIIVDAGNGAGGFFATKVLKQLGAMTNGSQFLEPDGRFPNHVPNPEDKVAMQSICDAVKDNEADLGIIFDTDVDRSAIVDNCGNAINRNALIALISAVILDEHPGSTIVTDSITSEGLTQFIEMDLKGKHHRFKRGYKNVINESIKLNDEGVGSWLAIETSGHAALKENYFLDDGAYLVAKLLVEMAKLNKQGKNLTDLIASLKQPVESKEIRFSIKEDDFLSYGKSVLDKLEAKVCNHPHWRIVTPNYEGMRVRCLNSEENGWFLLRMSLHDPVMPLNIESNIAGGVKNIVEELRNIMAEFTGLDQSVL